MKNYLLSLVLLLIPLCAQAQITGTVTDEDGVALPFASVYIEGSSKGTNTNSEGNYTLDPDPGSYTLVFQYVGYEVLKKAVRYTGEPLALDAQLTPVAIDLQEVTIKANAEDPAYAIMRKAIDRREFHSTQIGDYQTQAYVKGKIKLLDAPESILGQDIGDLGGTLDSNRQGILYLSESKSDVYFRQPDQFREEMIYSKVSGNDQGFSFNRAADLDISLYDTKLDFTRRIISPLANNAMGYYRFRLLGTFYTEEGLKINKIELIPKRPEDPVLRGSIYIVEDYWNLHSTDVYLTRAALNVPALDTLRLKQIYVPQEDAALRILISQTLSFQATLFAFEIKGDFTAVYSDYNLQPNFPEGTFGREVFRVEEGANDQDAIAWDSLRPIPLTEEERIDYVRKDSLQEVRQSKSYLDSVDAENNAFGLMDLFTGYSYNRSYKGEYFSIRSPLNTVLFNPVQGFHADLQFNYRRVYEPGIRFLQISPRLNYGFSDQQFRVAASLLYQPEQIHLSRVRIAGGREALQFNDRNPILPRLASSYATLGRRNFIRLYDKVYGRIGGRRELFNGFLAEASLEYAQRKPLTNTSDYSFFGDDDKSYATNHPLLPTVPGDQLFDAHRALLVELDFEIRFRQTYSSFPNRRQRNGSPYPRLYLQYRAGLDAFDSDVRFMRVNARLEESYMPIGALGVSQFSVDAGTFLQDDRLFFMDLRHFDGAEIGIGQPDRYLRGFFRLPYYDYSTAGDYVQAHYEHNFNGVLLDRLPLLRKLGFSTVIGSSVLLSEGRLPYKEINLGLDNIGFGLFRLFRVDVVFYQQEQDWKHAFTLGIKL